jgi:hypothetical protein
VTQIYSIAQARQAVEHLIALAGNGAASTVIDAAKYAATVLAWLERRSELVKAIEDLDRRAPELAKLLLDFPGAKIADVRPRHAFNHQPNEANDADYYDTLA